MKMNSIKRWLLIFVLVLLALALVACGKGTDSLDNNNFTEGEVDDSAIGSDVTADKLPQDAKIIREVTINGETKNFDDAAQSIKAQLAEVGGYIEKSDISGGTNLKSGEKTAKRATYTLRIPAEKLDSFLAQTEGVLNITSSTESTTDVTLEYYDVESRINTLKAKKAALEDMLTKAQTLDEILLIQNDLYAVIEDIEAYQSQLNLLAGKVNYSTVTLTVKEVLEFTESDEEAFFVRIGNAFVKTWQVFWQFLQDFAVFLVYCTPLFAVAAVFALIIWAIVAVCRKKSKKKKANKGE